MIYQENFYGNLPTIEERAQIIINFIKNLEIKIPVDEESTPTPQTEKYKYIRFDVEDLDKIKQKLRGLTLQSFESLFEEYKRNNQKTLEKISSNFSKNIQQFNLTPDQWKECIIKEPALFYKEADKLNKIIERVCNILNSNIEGLNIEKKDYIQVCLRRPILFGYSPELIYESIKDWAKFLKKSEREVVEMAFQEPRIFTTFSNTPYP